MRRGFTLIEVLVASTVLVVVASAVVGLTNAIIKNINSNRDTTQYAYAAQEGLNITERIRNEAIQTQGAETTDPAANSISSWLVPYAQVDSSIQQPILRDYPVKYGWYELVQSNKDHNWYFVDPSISNSISLVSNSSLNLPSNAIIPGTLATYRLICVESYGSDDSLDNNTTLNCNNPDGSDGSRTITSPGNCDSDDYYCKGVFNSTTNCNNPDGSDGSRTMTCYIPPGNAVKIKSVVIWTTQANASTSGSAQNYKYIKLSTVLTDWSPAGSLSKLTL